MSLLTRVRSEGLNLPQAQRPKRWRWALGKEKLSVGLCTLLYWCVSRVSDAPIRYLSLKEVNVLIKLLTYCNSASACDSWRHIFTLRWRSAGRDAADPSLDDQDHEAPFTYRPEGDNAMTMLCRCYALVRGAAAVRQEHIAEDRQQESNVQPRSVQPLKVRVLRYKYKLRLSRRPNIFLFPAPHTLTTALPQSLLCWDIWCHYLFGCTLWESTWLISVFRSWSKLPYMSVK